MHIFLTTGSLLLHYSPHSYLSSFPTPLNFSHFPPHFWSPPPYSVHMSTVYNYSATPFLSIFISADNSYFLPQPGTQISLQYPFITDSTFFPDFSHRKNKSWLQAADMKTCLYVFNEKKKSSWLGRKIYIYDSLYYTNRHFLVSQ